MFNKLKSKLKEKLSFFSKKTQEEAQDTTQEVEVAVPQEEVQESTPKEEAQPIKEEKEQQTKAKEELTKEEVIEEKKPSPKEEKKDKPIIKKDTEAKEEKKVIAKKETAPQKEKIPSPKKEQPKVCPPPPQEEEKEEPQEKTGFFKKIKQVVTTKKISSEKFEDLFWDLELLLLEHNVALGVIEKIKENLKAELVDKPLPRNVLKKIEEVLSTTLKEVLDQEPINLLEEIAKKEGPYIIAFFGINGAGKTTSIAKVAHYLQENNITSVLAACDTFRAAAIQQLEEHATNLNLKIIKHDYGSDAAAVAYDAIQHAKKHNIQVVLIDTAGRLHSNTNLMAELEKIIRVTQPDLKLFVGESITGNDCIEQAEKFNSLVGVDGAILTKADVDEMGGAPLSVAYTIKKPILFLGMGQEYKDLEVFNKDRIIEQLGISS